MLPHTTVALRRRAPEALAALDAAAGVRDGGAGAAAGQPRRRPAAARPRGHRGRRWRRASAKSLKRGQDLEGTPPAAERGRGQSSLRGGLLMLELLTDLMDDADGRCAYAEARHVDVAQRGDRRPQRPRRRDRQLGVGGHRRARAGRRRLGLRRHARRHARRARRRRWPARSPSPRRSRRRRTGPLAPVTPALGHWASPYEVDPFAVTLEDKLELLFAAEAALRTGDERLVRTAATCRAWRERKAFASTEGAACTQETVAAGAGIAAYATDGSDLQVRSYPTAHGGGLSAAAGWEHVLAPRPRRPRPARGRGGGRAAQRAAVPAGHEHDRPARRAGRAPGPRVDRARARARPHPARRGLLRGHELGRRPTTSARCATARTCCTSPPTRPSPAAWARSAGTTRASPPCAPTSSRAASCAARCPTARAPRPSA